MKILAIVGSTQLANHPEAKRLIHEIIVTKRPTKVISGGAEGVDSMAIHIARGLGLDCDVYRPDIHRWDGGDAVGFKQRNEMIAQACTELVRIVARSSKTYGSGWTRDRAAKLGKPTTEYVVEA